MEPNQIYLQQSTNYISHLLSWQAREPFSVSYGCFDRTFWCWKFTDFAGARFQEGVYALSYLYRHSFEKNRFYEHPQMLKWILAGMRFWQNLQYKDGSFDEAYPFERSLAATAFTSFYVGEGYLEVSQELSTADRDSLIKTFQKAGDWLCANDEKHGVLSNHLAAAAAALYTIYRITGEEKYENRSHYFLQRIYEHQSDEGWYEEYGGADPGYQTHGTFYLARIWQLNQDAELLESMRKSVSFLKYFIHPNRTLGGEYGSRNTEFYFPAGFEILATELSDAALITSFMRQSVAEQCAVGISAMDAYNFLPMFNNYLFAAENASKPDADGVLPWQQEGEWEFPDAGLIVKSTPSYYAVIGASKGGVLKIYDKEGPKLVISDCGFWAHTAKGDIISCQHLQRPAQSRVERAAGSYSVNGDMIIITSDFVKVNQKIFNPTLFIGFRLFSLTLGRFKKISYWLKNLLVKVLVSRKKKSPLRLTRRISFEENDVHLEDQIELLQKCRLDTLKAGSKFATIHMGSSRYFQAQELEVGDKDPTLRLPDACNLADEFNRNGHVEIKRNISVS